MSYNLNPGILRSNEKFTPYEGAMNYVNMKQGRRGLSELPLISPSAKVGDSWLGCWTEVGANTQVMSSKLDDYSYIMQDGDVASSTIGKFCSIARAVRINASNHPTWRVSQHHWTYRAQDYGLGDNDSDFFEWREQKPVTIGHDVWIGHGAILLPGVKVGNGAVIGAGAVVTKDIPSYCIAVGVPAEPIRDRFNCSQTSALEKIAYWHWPRSMLRDSLHDIRQLSIDEFIEKYGETQLADQAD